MTQPGQSRPTGPADVEQTFGRWLSSVRRRWWARRALEALALTAAVALIAAGVGIAYMVWARFDDAAVAAVRIAVYATVALAVLIVMLPRLLRRLSRVGAARYAEARAGDLDALLVSAAEASERARGNRQPVRDGSLEHALLARAAAACGGSDAIRRLEFARMRRVGAGLAATVLAAGALVLWGTAPMQHGLALLLAPAADAAAGNPYRLAVRPGDVVRVAGDDQAISALPDGFRPQSVELLTRAPGEDAWTATPMIRAQESDAFEALLFDLEGPREYYVRSGPIESARHRIEVTPRPRVSRIDLRYEYPARTGRAPELVQDGGPIRAVRGTRVELRIVPRQPVAAGELVIDGERRIPLQAADGELHATLTLERDGRYRIELPAGAAGLVPASTEHPIQVHDDERPTVALEWPGRDTHVTSIQEVEISVRAEDDVAVRELELVLNINGAEDRVIALATDPARPTVASGTHVLALEELALAPGDLISYYARARDAPDDPERVVTTDLYFMDVRPFEQRFTRAAGGGGGGGGGGGQGQGDPELTAQQRSLVVALFKLDRDQNTLDESVLRNRLETIEEAQARIRDRVDAIARRIGARAFVSGNQSYRTLAEELPRASRAMRETESRLAIRELDAALPSARRALLHLQRADAAFRDVQVAMNQSGGGGGQNDSSQQQLAALFQLEMDKFRNQYEDLQRGRWNAPEQSVDDTLAKLRELARRQQREIERTRLRGQRGQGGDNSQQALANELEELTRELERLTRHRDQARAEQAERSVEQLRSARSAMERAGRTGDAEAGQQALEGLRDARRDLEGARGGSIAGGVGEARERAESALAEQRAIRRRLENEFADGTADTARTEGLADRKRQLANDLGELAGEVDRLRRQARSERPGVAPDLEAAEQALRGRRLEQRMRQSADALELDPEGRSAPGESELERDLDIVRQRLARADNTLRGNQEHRGEETLEQLRAMVRGLKADQQRLADAAGSGSPQAGGEGNANQPVSPSGGAANGGGSAGGTSSGGGTTDGYDGGSGGSYDADLADLRQQTLERMQQLNALREDFPDIGAADSVARNVEAVIGALRQFGEGATADELRALREHHADLFAQMQRLEARLRDAPERAPETLTARQRVEIAPRYQDLIERYYRGLSEEPTAR